MHHRHDRSLSPELKHGLSHIIERLAESLLETRPQLQTLCNELHVVLMLKEAWKRYILAQT